MGITTKEIAKICGVSRTTVHRALNNTGRISEKTKRMILETAEKWISSRSFGYRAGKGKDILYWCCCNGC